MSTDTTSTTLGYYDQNAAQFANDTLDVELTSAINAPHLRDMGIS